jgi:hypothetical protein
MDLHVIFKSPNPARLASLVLLLLPKDHFADVSKMIIQKAGHVLATWQRSDRMDLGHRRLIPPSSLAKETGTNKLQKNN